MKVYVGTYNKYNEGSIAGAWLDLEDYTNKDEFYEACQELHDRLDGEQDEYGDYVQHDHEFMFQDWEGIPSGMIEESWLNEKVFQLMDLDDYEKEIVEIYMGENEFDENMSFESIIERFAGIAQTCGDFAEQLAADTGAVSSENASWIVIDWEATWKCNLRFDYEEIYHAGEYYFFHNY